MKFNEIVSKRVAGIPIVYVALAVASILLVLALRSKPTVDAPPDTTVNSADNPQNPSAELDTARGFRANAQGDASLYDPNTSVMVPVPQNNPDGNMAERTNDDWLRDAVAAQVKLGNAGGPVQSALQAYLTGKQLTAEQAKIRDWAIREFGLPPNIPDSPESEPPVSDNESWIKAAIAEQVKDGANAITVNEALRAYIAGQPLSTAQIAIRDRAVAKFGLPPNPPTASNPVKDDVARPQGTLPRTHIVKNSNDDTLQELARLYYPTSDTATIVLIRNANLGKFTGDGPFKPGTGIYLPKYTAPKYYSSTSKTNTLKEIAAKNRISQTRILTLNPGMKFPVKSGTRVRVA